MIIFEDAKLENAISAAMLANFFTQGEVCSNGTRVFVHTDIYDEFLAAIKKRTENLVVGNPLSPQTQVGALIHPKHMEKVCSTPFVLNVSTHN